LSEAEVGTPLSAASLSPETFEGLTNSLADTQEEVDAWLKALWAYVCDDGPEIDLLG